MAIHFKSSKERLDYLKGKNEEIIPIEVVEDKPKKEAKPKKKKSAPKEKKKEDGEV